MMKTSISNNCILRLNKNLNFLQTPKVQNQNELGADSNDFFGVSSLRRILKTRQTIKMIKRADCSNKTKAINELLQITIIQ